MQSNLHNSGVPKKRGAERLEFEQCPNSATFVTWKMYFNSEDCSSSSFPTEATVWINEVDSAKKMDGLKSSSSLLRQIFQTSRYMIQKMRVLSRSY